MWRKRWIDRPWIWVIVWTLFFAVPTTVNAFSVLSEASQRGWTVQIWEPFVWEYTSLAGSLVAAVPFTWLMLRGWKARPWWRLGMFGIAAAGVYALTHIVLMVLARHGVYALAGETYDFGDWGIQGLYEMRKDAVTCMTMVALVAAVQTIRDLRRHEPPTVSVGEKPTFIYSIGGRVVRLPPTELHYIRASDHHAEIVSDRAVHLVRRSLADIERALTGTSVVRTHRSWLVNLEKVQQTDPTPSGDWKLLLPQGVIAPLSRRYRPALRRLNGEAPAAGSK